MITYDCLRQNFHFLINISLQHESIILNNKFYDIRLHRYRDHKSEQAKTLKVSTLEIQIKKSYLKCLKYHY